MPGYLALSLCACNGGHEENYKKGCVNPGHPLLITLHLGSLGKGEVVSSLQAQMTSLSQNLAKLPVINYTANSFIAHLVLRSLQDFKKEKV